LADHLAAQRCAGDADRIVDAVAGLIVGLGGGANVSADAAEPEQIGIELEDRRHDLLRRELLAIEAEQRNGVIAQRDLLGAARIDAAAAREIILVVILPARAREIEQPLALLEAALRIGVGINEDVAMVEGRNEFGGAF